MPYEAPKQVKTEQIKKKNPKPANHTPESTTLIDKVEECEFETFLPSQLNEMEHSFPNIFDNNSFSDPAIEPSVETPPADEDILDSLEPTVGSPPSPPDSNVSGPEPVPMVEETPASPEEPVDESPRRMRQPPMILSYYNLGDLIEMQAQINTINYSSFQPAFIPRGLFLFIPPLPQYLFQSPANYLPIQFCHQLAPVFVKPAPCNWFQYYGKLPVYGNRNL